MSCRSGGAWTSAAVGAAHPARKAFTLIELMVVLVIIGLLASVVTINVRAYLTKGKQSTARLEIATICTALDTFYGATGRYPSNQEGIAMLAKASPQLPEPLLKQLPTDPWGRPYQYLQPGRTAAYEVICLGADGKEGGGGVDADLSSTQLKDTASPGAAAATGGP